MSDFSTRFGYEQKPHELAEDEMPETLRSGLWDAARMRYFDDPAKFDIIGQVEGYTDQFYHITNSIWFNHYRESIDTRPRNPLNARLAMREKFFGAVFYKVYEFLEFVACSDSSLDGGEEFGSFCNTVLERERAAFRFAGTTLVKITSEKELSEVKDAIEANASTGVQKHIKRSAELYSAMPAPDYRNSIKESISAVEAAVRYVTGTKGVGVSRPLKKIADEFSIHPALRDGFEKLYAYTSDAEGIRHAILDEQGLTQDDARYMLVSCSAFANYLVALKAKQT